MSNDNFFEIEELIAKRYRKGKAEYYIKWLGYQECDNTWEPEENIPEDVRHKLDRLLKVKREKFFTQSAEGANSGAAAKISKTAERRKSDEPPASSIPESPKSSKPTPKPKRVIIRRQVDDAEQPKKQQPPPPPSPVTPAAQPIGVQPVPEEPPRRKTREEMLNWRPSDVKQRRTIAIHADDEIGIFSGKIPKKQGVRRESVVENNENNSSANELSEWHNPGAMPSEESHIDLNATEVLERSPNLHNDVPLEDNSNSNNNEQMPDINVTSSVSIDQILPGTSVQPEEAPTPPKQQSSQLKSSFAPLPRKSSPKRPAEQDRPKHTRFALPDPVPKANVDDDWGEPTVYRVPAPESSVQEEVSSSSSSVQESSSSSSSFVQKVAPSVDHVMEDAQTSDYQGRSAKFSKQTRKSSLPTQDAKSSASKFPPPSSVSTLEDDWGEPTVQRNPPPVAPDVTEPKSTTPTLATRPSFEADEQQVQHVQQDQQVEEVDDDWGAPTVRRVPQVAVPNPPNPQTPKSSGRNDEWDKPTTRRAPQLAVQSSTPSYHQASSASASAGGDDYDDWGEPIVRRVPLPDAADNAPPVASNSFAEDDGWGNSSTTTTTTVAANSHPPPVRSSDDNWRESESTRADSRPRQRDSGSKRARSPSSGNRFAQPTPDGDTWGIVVTQLPMEATNADSIESFFSKFGNVLNVFCPLKHPGMVFVSYDSPDAVANALSVTEYEGQKIRIKENKNNPKRSNFKQQRKAANSPRSYDSAPEARMGSPSAFPQRTSSHHPVQSFAQRISSSPHSPSPSQMNLQQIIDNPLLSHWLAQISQLEETIVWSGPLNIMIKGAKETVKVLITSLSGRTIDFLQDVSQMEVKGSASLADVSRFVSQFAKYEKFKVKVKPFAHEQAIFTKVIHFLQAGNQYAYIKTNEFRLLLFPPCPYVEEELQIPKLPATQGVGLLIKEIGKDKKKPSVSSSSGTLDPKQQPNDNKPEQPKNDNGESEHNNPDANRPSDENRSDNVIDNTSA